MENHYLLLIDKLCADVNYYLYQYWIDSQDPRTTHFPLIDINPLFVIVLLTFYYVLVNYIIPYYMENREPFVLRKPILTYNALMALGNLWAFILCFAYIDFSEFFNIVYPTDKSSTLKNRKEFVLGYIYLVSKAFDLLDTVFFALRKKYSHITVLHLYHHITVPIFGWLIMKINPMIPCVRLFALMNTFIHFIMYSYYFLAAFGPTVRKYLWWKRYITQMQLGQFIILGFYGFMMVLFQQDYPQFWFWIAIPQPLFFFYMFYDFYRKAYPVQSDDFPEQFKNNINDKVDKTQ